MKRLFIIGLVVVIFSACSAGFTSPATPEEETRVEGASITATTHPTNTAVENKPSKTAVIGEGGGTPEPTEPVIEERVLEPVTVTPLTRVEGEKETSREPTSDVPETPFPQEWMNMPVIPEVSETAREIYQEGLKKGNNPQAFSKIGDCQNIREFYLGVFASPSDYTLGEEYQYLQPTIDYFQGSFNRKSMAVKGGLNVAAVLSDFRADPDQCESGQSPLECELENHQPSFAILSFEEWWGGVPAEKYAKYLRQIVEMTIENGTVPILATKADNLEGDHSINQAIVQIAEEYDVPLWNFWRAVQELPNDGLAEDGFHLTYWKLCNDYTDSDCMKYAWPRRNLTALQALHAVKEGVQGEEAANR